MLARPLDHTKTRLLQLAPYEVTDPTAEQATQALSPPVTRTKQGRSALMPFEALSLRKLGNETENEIGSIVCVVQNFLP
jgi:hypothetical protein